MPAPLALAAAPALIGAAASIGGAIFGNRANAREAQKNRDFQERMSNTANRRARDDMLSAGINPAQLASGGSSASTPGGATATASNPLEGGVSSARETARAMLEMRNLRESENLLKAQVLKTRTEGATSEALGSVATENSRAIAQQRAFDLKMQPSTLQALQLQNRAINATLPGAEAQAAIDTFLGPKGRAAIQAGSGLASTALGASALKRNLRASTPPQPRAKATP